MVNDQPLSLQEALAYFGLASANAVIGPSGQFDLSPLLGRYEFQQFQPKAQVQAKTKAKAKAKAANGEGTQSVDVADVVVSIIGGYPYATAAELLEAAKSYPVGVRLLLLFGGEPSHAFQSENLKILAKANLQFGKAVVLRYPHIRVAAQFRLVSPKHADTPSEIENFLKVETALGLANALVGTENETQDLLRAIGSEAQTQSIREENAILQRELEIVRGRMHASLSRLDHVERSATWRVGDAVVGMGRSPQQAWRVLPKLFQIWRGRKSRTVTRGSSATATTLVSGEQMLGNYPIQGLENQPLIGLVGDVESLTRLAEDFAVVSLAPHNLIARLESSRPALLVITTRAAEPDSLWCYLGSAQALDKEKQLINGLTRARALGVPSLLLQPKATAGDWRAVEAAVDASWGLDSSKELNRAVNKYCKQVEVI